LTLSPKPNKGGSEGEKRAVVTNGFIEAGEDVAKVFQFSYQADNPNLSASGSTHLKDAFTHRGATQTGLRLYLNRYKMGLR
jgi:hypothetical protein